MAYVQVPARWSRVSGGRGITDIAKDVDRETPGSRGEIFGGGERQDCSGNFYVRVGEGMSCEVK